MLTPVNFWDSEMWHFRNTVAPMSLRRREHGVSFLSLWHMGNGVTFGDSESLISISGIPNILESGTGMWDVPDSRTFWSAQSGISHVWKSETITS
jgi:hypothetical protein